MSDIDSDGGGFIEASLKHRFHRHATLLHLEKHNVNVRIEIASVTYIILIILDRSLSCQSVFASKLNFLFHGTRHFDISVSKLVVSSLIQFHFSMYGDAKLYYSLFTKRVSLNSCW